MRVPFHSLTTSISLFSFYVFYTIAAALYPGGVWDDPSTTGYSLWRNYLCAVLKKTAHNGQPNIGRGYGILAFLLLFATLIFWWGLLNKLLSENSSILRRGARIASILSAVGFVATLITPPAQELISAHFFSVLFAVLFGLVATILPLVGLLQIPTYRPLGLVGLVLISPAVINLLIWAPYHLGVFDASDALILVLQKIVVIAATILFLLSVLKQVQMATTKQA